MICANNVGRIYLFTYLLINLFNSYIFIDLRICLTANLYRADECKTSTDCNYTIYCSYM